MVHLNLETGVYGVKNHSGRDSYEDYDLLTNINPENYTIRGLTRNMTRRLDRHLWLTDKFYQMVETATGEESPERWDQWKEDFLDPWKATLEEYENRSARRFRWSLRVPK